MSRLTCTVLLAALALQCAPTLAGTPVRIAVTSGGHGTTSLKPLDQSVRALEARFGPSNVTIRERVTLTELGHMLERGEVDYFISTSGVSRRNLSEGSRDLLTITDSRFPDPNKSYGSLFFTRRGSGIKNLEDMRGRTLVANHPNGPYSYLVGMGEIMSAPQGLSGSAARTPGLTQKKSSGDSGSVAQPVSMSAAASAARPLKEADVIVDAPPCMCSVL